MRAGTGGLLLGLALAGCGGNAAPSTFATPSTTAAPAAAAVVRVADNSFGPQVLTVPAGSAVEWRWTGAAMHDVTFDAFASPIQSAGTWRHTFAQAGTYAYRCTLHEHMLGEVVVR